jgi:Rod binding domain-containing protein
MNAANLLLNDAVSSSPSIDRIKNTDTDTEAKKVQFSKDFESIFVGKLLEVMKDSIVDWNDEKDGSAKQVESLFWSQLGENVSDNGGLGLWKDIYKSLDGLENKSTEQQSLNEMI